MLVVLEAFFPGVPILLPISELLGDARTVGFGPCDKQKQLQWRQGPHVLGRKAPQEFCPNRRNYRLDAESFSLRVRRKSRKCKIHVQHGLLSVLMQSFKPPVAYLRREPLKSVTVKAFRNVDTNVVSGTV